MDDPDLGPPAPGNALNQRWIFVSHASQDIVMVRRVRNYLERNGGNPLLFHLRALEDPEEFWPLIEKEIQSRNFFLFCDSPAAQQSEWVRREREVAQKAAAINPKRMGRLDVSGSKLDKAALNDFLADRKVFLGFSQKDQELVTPFRTELAKAGFKIVNIDLDRMSGETLSKTIERSIRSVVTGGWFVRFISPISLESRWELQEAEIANRLGAKVVSVAIGGMQVGHLGGESLIASTPPELVRFLLESPRS